MIRMPHFLQNRSQRFLFAGNFRLQKFLPAPDLLLKDARPRLPRKCDPRQKRRPLPLRRPFLALQSIRQRGSPLRRRCKTAALRPRSGLFGFERANHPSTRQFFQRIVNLRTRNPRPIPNLAPLQFRIRLIPVHRPLRQQAEQNQIRRRQLQFFLRVSNFPQSPGTPLGAPRLCVYLFLFLFLSLVALPFISLRPYFVVSSFCSTTTTGTSLPPTADSSPAPPPRKKYRARTDPAAAPSRAPSFHTSVGDSAAPTPPRCGSPAIRNPAASPAQSKSNL